MSRVVLIGLTVTLLAVSVSVPIYIFLGTPEHVPAEVIGDFDGDGVPDNEDFYDSGNGGVEIKISDFVGSCGNWLEPCEPKFRLLVDGNGDGSYEQVRERSFGDTDTVQEVMVERFDIPDAATKVKFKIEVLDQNSLVGGDHMDYLSHLDDRWGFFESDLTSGHSQWTKKGNDTPFCSFRVVVNIVEIGL